jgi:hypothetical protein
MFDKRKKYGVKIKRTKTLYKFKKTPLQKAVNTAATLIVVSFLAVAGYSAGKPLVEFLRNGGESSLTEDTVKWTPPSESEITPGISGNTPGKNPSESANPQEKEKPPVPAENIRAVYAPDSVLTDENALSAFLVQAKSLNYNAAAVELKNSDGYILYKSELPVFAASPDNPQNPAAAEIVKGTMPLRQIKDVFDKEGLTPIVKINTISDHAAPKYFDGMNYRFNEGGNSYKWVDDRPDRGGKPWSDPFKDETKNYVSDIVNEVSAAGFPHIILSGTVFPPFRPYDASILPAQYSDMNSRLNALINLIEACVSKKGGAKLYTEMTASDILGIYLTASRGYNFRTAEILNGKDKLTGIDGIVVKINLADCRKIFSALPASENLYTIGDSTSADTLCKYISDFIREKISPSEFIPCIETSGVAQDDLIKITGSVQNENLFVS